MTEAQREAIKAALRDCEIASKLRNDLVHGVKTASRVPDGNLRTIKSRRNTYEPAVTSWTIAEIGAVATKLMLAGNSLFAAVGAAVSPEVMVLDQALAWESYHRGPSGG